MVRKHSRRSCTVGVQKYICIVDFASGLSRTDVSGSGNVLLDFR